MILTITFSRNIGGRFIIDNEDILDHIKTELKSLTVPFKVTPNYIEVPIEDTTKEEFITTILHVIEVLNVYGYQDDYNGNPKVFPLQVKLTKETTAGTFEDADFQKGDRVIVNWGTIKEPEMYVATVIQVSNKKRLIRVEFDDGHKENYAIDNKGTGVIGYCNNKRKRKSELPIDLVDDWLDQDLWYSSSLSDVNRPGFTLKQFKGKTPKATKKMIPNKIIVSKKSIEDLSLIFIAELNRIFGKANIQNKGKYTVYSFDNLEVTDLNYEFELSLSDTKLFKTLVYLIGLVKNIKVEENLRLVKGKMYSGKVIIDKTNELDTINKALRRLKPVAVAKHIEQQIEVTKELEKTINDNVKKVEKERLADVQIKMLDKDAGQIDMYNAIKKAGLPIYRVWYETEETDLSFDLGNILIEQSAVDLKWSIVERVGKGHKYHPETGSIKKIIQQALQLTKNITASFLTKGEVLEALIYNDYDTMPKQEGWYSTAQDLTPNTPEEIDSNANPFAYSPHKVPRYVISMYNAEVAKYVIKNDPNNMYSKNLVHSFHVSYNPSLPSAVTEALWLHAQNIQMNSELAMRLSINTSNYGADIYSVYQYLCEQLKEGTLLIQYSFI